MTNRPARIGKYEIIDVIGEGGMGAVYKGVDPDIGRTVAIKVIKGDFTGNPELLKRFRHEAKAVGNLQHPNIVVVYEMGIEHGNPYLVMEYLDGVPLDKVIARRQSYSLVQKLGMIIEALNALHYAHQRDIVHRDIKPANVMVLKDAAHIKLLDFGIARQGDTGQTKTGQMMGTMWYMSQEQFDAPQTVDGRSDVFSTGIVLYELLAYTLPFSTTDMAYLMKRMRGEPPPLLSTYLQSYPPELDEIIARSQALRDLRYNSAEEFAFELARVQDRLKRDMVSHYVDQARESIERSDLTKARELLSEVVRLDTQNQTAKQLLYEIQQTLQKTARTEKKNQLRDQASRALSEKQLETAEKFADEAIKLDATDTDLLNLKEQIELAKGRAQQVKKLLTLAKVAQQTGELAVAKKAVEDALKLDPLDTDAKLMGSAIARLMVDYEKQCQIQQFLQAARREVEARQFTAANENIAKAKAIDPNYPEIAGLERMSNAGRDQEVRQKDLVQLRSQIQQELNAGRAWAARDFAASAIRKFPGEQDFVRLKSVAEAAIEKEERRAHIDERIATASKLVEGGEATRALRLLKDAEREHPTDLRLREYLEVVQQAAARETTAREKQQLLLHARNAMRGRSFSEAIRLLESGLVQFPEDSEIKGLLKTAREEFDLLSKKKQVEEVSKQAQNLLQSRAHTDAIRLLERTSTQVSDPELVRLLEYAKEESRKFHAAVQGASDQATQMLNLGQPSEAVTFLEAQVDKYGKDADFLVLLEQARKQAREAERAKQRLLANLRDARAKLRAGDIHGAEALLHVCEAEGPSEPDVQALAVEIDEEKKAVERRRAEADRLAEEKAAAEPGEQAAAPERATRESVGAPRSGPSFDAGGATVLDGGGSAGVPPSVMIPPDAGAAAVARAKADEVTPMSATQAFSAHPASSVDSAVLTPPPIEMPPAKPAEKKKEPKRKGRTVEVSPQAFETVISPVSEQSSEVASLRMETIVEEPKPAPPPPRIPLPPAPPPPDLQPPRGKKPILIAGGGLAVLVLAVVVWFLVHNPTPKKITETHPTVETSGSSGGTQPQPSKALLKIIAPPGANFSLGDYNDTIRPDGTAEVETKPGTYTLKVTAPDFKPYSGSVTLELGRNEPWTVSMQPLHDENLGYLIVKANVDHFDVFVDGQAKSNSGRAQQVRIEGLKEGTHKVLIKKSGFDEPKDQSVKITAKKDQTALFVLNPGAPTDAALSVTVRPGGRIRIDDGQPIPVPDGSYSGKLSPGSHKVEAGADGYQTQTKPVTAKAGEPASLAFELMPNPAPPKPEPTISVNPLTADIDQGKSVTIHWSTQNATQVFVDGKPFDANSQTDVSPDEDTTITLIAKGPGGEKTEHVKVNVHAKVSAVVTPPPRDEKPEIMRAKDRWESAVNSLQVANVRTAWPGVTPEWIKKIQQNKDLNQKIRVTYTCKDPTYAGTNAEMKCTQLIALEKQTLKPTSVLFKLAKKGENWEIFDIVLPK